MTGDFGKHLRSGTNLIIHDLHESTSEEQLWTHFSSIGEVESTRVIRDRDTGRSLQYGFVNYINPRDAARAIETLSGQKLQSKTIKVSFARPTSNHKPHQGGMDGVSVPRIFIYNLGQDSEREDVRRLFGTFGAVSDVTVITDFRTNKCRGLAFVTMENYEEAVDAIAKLDGHRAGDNILRVFF